MHKSAHTARLQDVDEKYAPAGRLLDITVIGNDVLLEILELKEATTTDGVDHYSRVSGICVETNTLINALRFFGVKA